MIRLEYYRTNAGLSQDQLAEKIGMTQQRISAYELGKREPDLETLKLFADFFKISTDELLGVEKDAAYEAYAEALERKKIKEAGKEELVIGLSRGSKGVLTDSDTAEIEKFAEYVASKRKEGKQ